MLTPVALGTMTLSGRFNGLYIQDRDPPAARETLRSAWEAGCRVFDSAPIYARGSAESDLSGWAGLGACRVWTKVGVDIEPVLPRLDYSYDGLRRAFDGSLKRLNCSAVEGVLLHNPSHSTLTESRSSVAAFAAWCLAQKLASQVGISALSLNHMANVPIDEAVTVLMVETQEAERRPQIIGSLRCRYKLILRSPFAGGALIPEEEIDRRNWIRRRLCELARQFAPELIVVGCSTAAQVSDLAEVWRS
jgi:aryl-alcohol dehydrogenase-like predicted oxidoreductase